MGIVLTCLGCKSKMLSVKMARDNDYFINIQDIVLAVNLVLNNQYNNLADLNLDNAVDVLDIVQFVNIILN